MFEENKSLKQIIIHRIEKLNKLREMGFEPFPHKYEPTHKSTEILNNYKDLEKKRCLYIWKNNGAKENG